MASEERLRELEEKYEDYRVYDNRGDRIGKVDDLFVDETDREEYIGVKLGFLGMKSTLIPMDIVRVNEADRTIEVSDTKDRVKAAPSFDDDDDITGEYERRIRDHFGLETIETSASRGGYEGSSSHSVATTGAATGSENEHDDASHHERQDSTADAAREDDSRDHEQQHVPEADAEHSAGDAEHTDERTGTTSEGGSQSVPEYEDSGESRGSGEPELATSDEHRGSERSEGVGTDSGGTETSEGTTTGIPTSRQTEETETFQEGGRTKVRRRIVREEVIDAEDDPNARP
ncbi:MAG: PRC-barrel domain-containing protein [Rubrobacter sp.]